MKTMELLISLTPLIFSTIALFISWRVYALNKKNRDTNQRNKLYEKQFEIGQKINEHVGVLENIYESIGKVYQDEKLYKEKFYQTVESLDLYLTQNEIFLSDSFYKITNDYIIYLNQKVQQVLQAYDNIGDKEQQEFRNKIVVFLEDLREELQIEYLTHRNKI